MAADAPVDAFWQAQRLELAGRSDEALKRYNLLIAAVPTSAVAADRLLDTALLQGDMKSALRAIRAQQLANAADADSPLLLFVDGWKRKDWKAADAAVAELKERESFAFMVPILNAWKNVAQGKESGLTTAALRADPMLGYYSVDQLVYIDLAQGNLDSAKERLTRLDGFAENFGRHVALTAVGEVNAAGDAKFASALMTHIGGQMPASNAKPITQPSKQLTDLGLAALFARLSDQLQSQSANDKALYFARLAHWTAPSSDIAKLTLARRLDEKGKGQAADALLASIPANSLHKTWAVSENVAMLSARGDKAKALALIAATKANMVLGPQLSLIEAELQNEAGDYGKAMAIYRSIIEASGSGAANKRQLAVYYMLLAQSLEKTNDWVGAKKQLEKALEIDSDNPQLLNYLGYSLLERREDIKRGFELVSNAHRLAPASPAITDSLGWGFFLSGDYARAVPLLESAASKALGDVTINEHMGDAYWKAGRRIEARYAWRAAQLSAQTNDAKRISSKIDIGLNESNASP
jgi:tetratricopeptide (TPR) repeat protein